MNWCPLKVFSVRLQNLLTGFLGGHQLKKRHPVSMTSKVAMEAGNFTQALAEFSSCLDARTSVLPKDSRYLTLNLV